MKFRKASETEIKSKDLLKEVSKCKPEEYENLLRQIEIEIEQSEAKEGDLLSAKIMITSRMASMRNRMYNN
jgi:hypothetical protein